MTPTPYANINTLLDEILQDLKNVFGERLIGLYLEGSLVWGDFDERNSDIDLLAITSADVSDPELEQLQKTYANFVKAHPVWQDRIETCFISVASLERIKTLPAQAVNISPGEPMHRITTQKEWIMSWYLTREKSLPLFGPPAKTIIEEISRADYIESVKAHVNSWTEWVKGMQDRNAQVAYVVLTLCRALYAVHTGDQVSKIQAGKWAQRQYPQWIDLIDAAIAWRNVRDEAKPSPETCTAMLEFLHFAQATTLNQS